MGILKLKQIVNQQMYSTVLILSVLLIGVGLIGYSLKQLFKSKDKAVFDSCESKVDESSESCDSCDLKDIVNCTKFSENNNSFE